MENKKHSQIGASGAHRWMNCPGSVALSELAPRSETSVFAAEGIAAHSLLEVCLVEARSAREFIGGPIEGFVVTEEMASSVQIAVDWVFNKREEVGGVIDVERSFDLGSIFPGLYGRNDVSIFKKSKKLVVADYKHGQTAVEVKENKQLLYYALGAAIVYNYDFEEIELVILQPRAPHRDGPIRSWSINKDYLVNWSQVLIDAAKQTQIKGAPLYRGAWCKYCPAVGICPKQNEAFEQSLSISTSAEIEMPKVERLSDEQIVKIIQNKKLIEDFVSEVQRVALSRLQSGEKINQLKLVAGRGRRVWANEEKAEAFLVGCIGDKAHARELISVAKAEKLVDKSLIEPLWVDVAGSETVAHESDKRKEIQPTSGTLILNKKGAI